MSCSQKIVLGFCAVLFLALGAARAETVYWGDNFQTNAGSRWTTNKVWQIGSPTAGPPVNAAGYRAYSGSRCATTGLKGNSAYNADSRFVCTSYLNGAAYLTIPDASQFPRLRFWQWYNFVNAGGFVEIQLAGSTNWQTISPTNISAGSTGNYSSGVWSRPSIDLSPYAGESVQIAFHFFSGGNYGTDPGWFVDDVAVVTGPPVFNDPEGFEGGQGDWAVDAGTWQIGIPTTGPAKNSKGFRAHSGTNCAATVLAGNYGWNVDTRLISAPFTVPTSGTQALRFSQWYSFINAAGFVEVNSSVVITNTTASTNVITTTNISMTTNVFMVTNTMVTNLDIIVTNITTVTNVFTFTNVFDVSTNITFNTTVTTNGWQTISATNISVGSSPVTSNGQWTNTTLDLSAFSGQTLQVAFHFLSGGSGYGSAAGWYIDDLTLAGLPILTVPANKTITKGQTFTATASATNSSLPNAKFTFALAAPSTNAFMAADGTFNWTNTKPAIATNTFAVTMTDDSLPPDLLTNTFKVYVWPVYNFSISNTLAGKKYFLLDLQTLSNTTWVIDASTDLMNWQPIFTNKVTVGGSLLFTDRLATNFPLRFYRAVYP